MHLILLVLIAFVIGYLLAGSRFRKPIDDASEKVTETSKSWAGKVGSWWHDLFKKEQPTESQVIDVSATSSTEQQQVAEKRPSRRKVEEEEEKPSE